MLNEKLMRIQTEIKAPKNLYNSFGKYKYRNAEGICEAVKPYLAKEKCALTLEDEIVEVGAYSKEKAEDGNATSEKGSRVYVKAIATLRDVETDETISVSAFARESAEKKGMDDSQITGTASSYARKYALNGLFLLDDTKDADTDEYAIQNGKGKGKTPEEQDAEATEQFAKEKIADVMVKALKTRCEKEGVPETLIHSLYHVKSLNDLTNLQYRNINDNWNKIVEKAKS